MPRNLNNDKPLSLPTLFKRLNYGTDPARSRHEDGQILNDRIRVFRSSASSAKIPDQWNSSLHRGMLKRLAEDFLASHGEDLWPDEESHVNYNPNLTYSHHAST
jgi:hypothetical protein